MVENIAFLNFLIPDFMLEPTQNKLKDEERKNKRD